MLSSQLCCRSLANGNSNALKQSGTYFSTAHVIRLHLGKEQVFLALSFVVVGFFFLVLKLSQLPKSYLPAILSWLKSWWSLHAKWLIYPNKPLNESRKKTPSLNVRSQVWAEFKSVHRLKNIVTGTLYLNSVQTASFKENILLCLLHACQLQVFSCLRYSF